MSHTSLVHHPDSSVSKTVYFVKDDWDITKYHYDPEAYVTHTCHDTTGYDFRYVTPADIFLPKFQCMECNLKAPDEVITVWVLLNWDKLNWSEIQ